MSSAASAASAAIAGGVAAAVSASLILEDDDNSTSSNIDLYIFIGVLVGFALVTAVIIYSHDKKYYRYPYRNRQPLSQTLSMFWSKLRAKMQFDCQKLLRAFRARREQRRRARAVDTLIQTRRHSSDDALNWPRPRAGGPNEAARGEEEPLPAYSPQGNSAYNINDIDIEAEAAAAMPSEPAPVYQARARRPFPVRPRDRSPPPPYRADNNFSEDDDEDDEEEEEEEKQEEEQEQEQEQEQEEEQEQEQ